MGDESAYRPAALFLAAAPLVPRQRRAQHQDMILCANI